MASTGELRWLMLVNVQYRPRFPNDFPAMLEKLKMPLWIGFYMVSSHITINERLFFEWPSNQD
jgi:hypothetical protein